MSLQDGYFGLRKIDESELPVSITGVCPTAFQRSHRIPKEFAEPTPSLFDVWDLSAQGGELTGTPIAQNISENDVNTILEAREVAGYTTQHFQTPRVF